MTPKELLEYFHPKFWRYRNGEYVWYGYDKDDCEYVTEPLPWILKRVRTILEDQ